MVFFIFIQFLKETSVKPLSHEVAVAQSCLIFQRALSSQENSEIFREKGPVKASSQQPWCRYGIRMAFYRVHTEFLLAIVCALMTLSQRSQCVHCTFHRVRTALSWHSHCADGVLKTQ